MFSSMQGLFMYWITSSLFSIGQISLLKFPVVRAQLGIPEMVKHPPAEKSGEGFFASAMSSKPLLYSVVSAVYLQGSICEAVRWGIVVHMN